MKDIKQLFESNVWLRVLTTVSVLLIIAGFVTPPMGVIDGSVLTACGELAGFGVLWIILLGIEKGVDVIAKHNDTEVTITRGEGETDSK